MQVSKPMTIEEELEFIYWKRLKEIERKGKNGIRSVRCEVEEQETRELHR